MSPSNPPTDPLSLGRSPRIGRLSSYDRALWWWRHAVAVRYLSLEGFESPRFSWALGAVGT